MDKKQIDMANKWLGDEKETDNSEALAIKEELAQLTSEDARVDMLLGKLKSVNKQLIGKLSGVLGKAELGTLQKDIEKVLRVGIAKGLKTA